MAEDGRESSSECRFGSVMMSKGGVAFSSRGERYGGMRRAVRRVVRRIKCRGERGQRKHQRKRPNWFKKKRRKKNDQKNGKKRGTMALLSGRRRMIQKKGRLPEGRLAGSVRAED